jgi:hypothetical protein
MNYEAKFYSSYKAIIKHLLVSITNDNSIILYRAFNQTLANEETLQNKQLERQN